LTNTIPALPIHDDHCIRERKRRSTRILLGLAAFLDVDSGFHTI